MDTQNDQLMFVDVLQGRPVLVVVARRHYMDSRNLDETKRLICYVLDNTAAAADTKRNPHSKLVCLFDLSGMMHNSPTVG